jgi:hypothetical protein
MNPRIRGRAARSTGGRTPPARLIHIGPHKTGTTTIQSALESNHVALTEHGVHYMRPRERTTLGVTAVTGVVEPGPTRDARMLEWERLLADAGNAERVVLSNEFLCEADREGAERVVRELGSHDTHVVVTLRPLSAILPSQWQQFVMSGNTTKFSSFVDAALAREQSPGVELFWRRHQHDELVARWADVVSPQNVTVVVCDSKDAEQLPRVFADLLGLQAEVLRPPAAVSNRSFTREEAEVVRRFNEQFDALNRQRAARGDAPLQLSNTQRLAAWRQVKRRHPRRDEMPIVLPDSAREPVARLSREIVERILSLGVNVIGDPQSLMEVPPPAGNGRKTDASSVPPGIGARVAMGLLSQVMTSPERK